MNTNIIIRIIFGSIFAVLSYFLVEQNFPHRTFFYIPYGILQAVISFLFGAFGFFFFPVMTKVIAGWFKKIFRSIAEEVVEQTLKIRAATSKMESPKKKITEKKEYENPMLLDTSAIIDGRIADIISTGFISGTLIVPQFVLAELQRIADSADALRRGRGRRGFEILDTLKKSPHVKFEILDQDVPRTKNVDDKLVRLAKQLKTKIITTDFNLNKVASVSGINILNVNELANSVKTVTLPGEEITLKVIQEGKEQDQGVGYLPDGTMIVVEHGSKYIGKIIEVVVSRVLQTVAGRMIFVQFKKEVENSSRK